MPFPPPAPSPLPRPCAPLLTCYPAISCTSTSHIYHCDRKIVATFRKHLTHLARFLRLALPTACYFTLPSHSVAPDCDLSLHWRREMPALSRRSCSLPLHRGSEHRRSPFRRECFPRCFILGIRYFSVVWRVAVIATSCEDKRPLQSIRPVRLDHVLTLAPFPPPAPPSSPPLASFSSTDPPFRPPYRLLSH